MCCLGTLEDSKLIHEQLCQNAPYKSDVLVGSNLVDMYANFGSKVGAWRAILANVTGRCACRLCTFMRLLNAWQISP
jgi:hypothetical protein